MIKGKFIDNLPKVYGIYTGGFIGFIILCFWFANRQEKIDEEFGFNEREDG